MIAALLGGWLLSAALGQAPDPGPGLAPDLAFEQRMRDSAAAAQALQGPLDGGWTLTDATGHTLYLLQIADPPHAAGPLTAAWTDPRTGALGPVDAILRVGDRLKLVFAPDPAGPMVRLTLRRLKGSVWGGWAASGGSLRSVRLSRP